MDENGLYPETDETFGQVTLDSHKIGTAIRISEELLNDSVFDLESYMTSEFARRIGTEEEKSSLLEMAQRNQQESLRKQMLLVLQRRQKTLRLMT